MSAIVRCPECGSWDLECGADKPQPGCGCVRCLRAKVERLRQAVGLATTAVPSIVIDASDPVGRMQRVVAEVERLKRCEETMLKECSEWIKLYNGLQATLDELRAEVERLRPVVDAAVRACVESGSGPWTSNLETLGHAVLAYMASKEAKP